MADAPLFQRLKERKLVLWAVDVVEAVAPGLEELGK